jgi:hypothetical protein
MIVVIRIMVIRNGRTRETMKLRWNACYNITGIMSVSRKQYRGKAQRLRTREKRDSKTKVREKKARGRKDLHRLFFSFSRIFIIILIG